MKSIIVGSIVLFGLLMNNIAFSQSKTRFGFKANPSLSWIKVSNAKDLSSSGTKVAFDYGVMLDHEFSQNYFFSTGIGLCYTGGKTKYAPISGNITTNYKLQYIEIPLGLKLRTSNAGPLKYWALLGTNFSVAIKSKYEVEGVSNSDDNFYSKTVPVSFGSEIGIGVEYPVFAKNVLTLGINYKNGLTKFNKKEGDDDTKLQVNNIGLKVGLFF